MKSLIVIAVAAALGGCAVAPPARPVYGTPVGQASGDPSQWRVVSVTPVAPGTGERNGSRVEYSSVPVYVPAPVYVPQPVYSEPAYYYPPVSLSLGFVFGRHWGGHGHHRGGHFRGRR